MNTKIILKILLLLINIYFIINLIILYNIKNNTGIHIPKNSEQISNNLNIGNFSWYKYIVFNEYYSQNKIIYYLNYINLNNVFLNDYSYNDSRYIYDDNIYLKYIQQNNINNTNIYFIKSSLLYDKINVNNTIDYLYINITENLIKYYSNHKYYIIKLNNINDLIIQSNNMNININMHI